MDNYFWEFGDDVQAGESKIFILENPNLRIFSRLVVIEGATFYIEKIAIGDLSQLYPEHLKVPASIFSEQYAPCELSLDIAKPKDKVLVQVQNYSEILKKFKARFYFRVVEK